MLYIYLMYLRLMDICFIEANSVTVVVPTSDVSKSAPSKRGGNGEMMRARRNGWIVGVVSPVEKSFMVAVCLSILFTVFELFNIERASTDNGSPVNKARSARPPRARSVGATRRAMH